jgi:type IV pilus assembly protein PilV
MLRRSRTALAAQRGAFLLEALIGILIFTLGVLGLLALQARATSYSNDAQYRGEAAYLANAYIAKMWADSRANLTARYDDAGEQEYDAFKAAVDRLPGAAAIAGNPQVTITVPPPAGIANAGGGVALTPNSTLVTIVIQWQQPALDDLVPVIHNYTISSILGVN